MTSRKQINTGPLKKTRDLVKARATANGVPLCEMCGKWAGTNIHHRQPRGTGGCRKPYINKPSNLLLAERRITELTRRSGEHA